MSQRDQQYLVMPPQPAAHLIMIQADFAFRFFEKGFDRPSHPADPDELDHWCSGRNITEVILDDRRIQSIAADDQPDFQTQQVSARLGQAQESEVQIVWSQTLPSCLTLRCNTRQVLITCCRQQGTHIGAVRHLCKFSSNNTHRLEGWSSLHCRLSQTQRVTAHKGLRAAGCGKHMHCQRHFIVQAA